MNKYKERARTIRRQLAAITKNFDDETAIENKELYPDWNGNGVVLSVGDVVLFDGNLYRAIQPHKTQPDWAPTSAVSLFKKISVDEFPQWVQPTGAHDAYNKGDKCSDEGKQWISEIDGNVWKPGTVPGTWTEVT